ncbi:hypothetical protein EHS13_23010 [Paenibacillus psychroresistens]|uniref:AbiJ-NTD3 domain-containing protein n=1 Tax=Paenibacillus psychroresistens TaxID=1778678 RepID=A0A6B8RPD5_9BACL|nr:hypothetical protein [Paenibacillus psychroresistens]QGQ97552.1 hypothetical protein EHS13_23010 [Paenibacillus psychroresistens]
MIKHQDIIDQISLVLSGEKSYDLPVVCVKYGLDNGDDSEAFKSKRMYITRRLKGKDQVVLIDIAKRIAKDYQSKELSKLLNILSPSGFFQITQITRNNIFSYLYSAGNIQGDLDLIDFLNRSWNLDTMPPIDSRYPNATRDIIQHMYANDDWNDEYLYEKYLDIFNLPDELFIHFIEQLVHPQVRKKNQEDYVNEINKHLMFDGYKLQITEHISGYPVHSVVKLFEGVKGRVKNLIFAADGLKPEIVLSDSISNDIKIVKNEEFCLVYDQQIPPNGLLWRDLVDWWAEKKVENVETKAIESELYFRLYKSLDSEPEKILFKAYFTFFKKKLGDKFPALIPQVYLHYDPYTIKQLEKGKRLLRQRMDFLLLFSNQIRIVLEVDGKQHYSEGDISSPKIYSEMVCADRELKLNGYEVFRFGGHELTRSDESQSMIQSFFDKLFKKYNI